jgi:branched-chain amino acid transport system permease protein
VAVLLALTGMFGRFSVLYVVGETLTLSTVMLVLLFSGIGYFAASRLREQDIVTTGVNGLVAGVIVGIALAIVVVIEANVDITFVFENLNRNPIGPILTFGQELAPGLAILLGISAVIGVITGAMVTLPPRVRRVILSSLGIMVVLGLLQSQLRAIITLSDMLAIVAALALSYEAARRFVPDRYMLALEIGAGAGAIFGLLLTLAVSNGGLAQDGILHGMGDTPHILSVTPTFPLLIIIFAVVGGVGALISRATQNIHNSAIYIVTSLLIIGLLNARGGMDVPAAVFTLAILGLVFWFAPSLANSAAAKYQALPLDEKRITQRLSLVVALIVLLVVPTFGGQYITGVLDRVGVYIIMGIGLNIVIGYAGLLDLGYAAFFAIGAYSAGLMTTPSLLTCGGIHPDDLGGADAIQQACTGVMTFWQAWPMAILITGLAGVLLGIPVLRLRGDYLAIVTLGFGEIIRLLTLSNDLKPLLGSAQGIAQIPGPVLNLTALNPDWYFELGNAVNIYYIILATVVVTAIIAIRLSNTRLGRAWRAMRADEDVAQATGVNLVRTKLVAFAIGAAFAGMGGAIFASWLQGIFPNSFGVLVSINVVSLIIIGGLGSIPGVVVGALILVGLPEVLRELQDYRLLAFGVLLVAAMLLRPEGMIPPRPRRLTQMATERAKEGGQA